jgi:hypothetical protein
MGARLSISGEDLLSALEGRLEHMLACETILFELYDHPDKPLVNAPKSARAKDLSQWDQEKLTDVIRWVERYRAEAELRDVQKLRPIEAFVAELPHLKRAVDLVGSVHYVLRHIFDDKTRVENNKIVYTSITQRLDTLAGFDDSE